MKKHKRYLLIAASILIICLVFPITAFADDIFTTGGTVTPEQDVYHVGETVDITDYFRNKGAANATSVSVEYYYRLNGGNSVYSGNPIDFGTVAGGESESHSYQYTFKEADIGEYRIGSKITYTLSGTVYQEYSSGHDFTVVEALTPTPTPTATATPEPTATPTPEASPTATAEPEATPIPSVSEAVSEPAATEAPADSAGGLFGINRTLLILLTVLAVLLLALIIAIIIVAAGRKKDRFR